MPFPDGFRWGVATAAYQIEGAVHEDGRGESIWDRFSHTPGRTANGDTGDVACDHYHRWAEDLDLIAAMGLGAYRFSVAWPRVFPDGTGRANRRGLDLYERLVDGLLERGIDPVVTLYHWDLPQALQDRGGWADRRTVDAFVAYADTVFRALGDRVTTWVTHNEPWVAAWVGHYEGRHAPGVRDLRTAVLVSHHLLLSHGLAVGAFRSLGRPGEVGIALNLSPVEPATDRTEDMEAAIALDGHLNRWFLDPVFRGRYPHDAVAWLGARGVELDNVRDGDLAAIAAPIDFLGVNYYLRRVAAADAATPLGWRTVEETRDGMPWVDDGSTLFPDAFEALLVRLKGDYGNPPILITENGAASRDQPDAEGHVDDRGRVAYLEAHIAAAERAIAAGVDLRGYLVWSLLDNFEWAFGYDTRFGIHHVDFATHRRTPKSSARFLARVAELNGLP